MYRRIAALAGGAILATGLAIAGTAGSAHGTTGTCLNIATPIAQPIGCGGLYFSGLGSGIQQAYFHASAASIAGLAQDIADALVRCGQRLRVGEPGKFAHGR